MNSYFKRTIEVTPSDENPFSFKNTSALTAKLNVRNLTDKPLDITLTKDLQDFEINLGQTTLSPKSSTNVTIKMDYEKLNPNQVNDSKFTISAKHGEEGEEPTNVDISISCLPRYLSEGKYKAEIKYTIEGNGFSSSFVRSQMISIDQTALENGASKEGEEAITAEETENKINKEIERMEDNMKNWNYFENDRKNHFTITDETEENKEEAIADKEGEEEEVKEIESSKDAKKVHEEQTHTEESKTSPKKSKKVAESKEDHNEEDYDDNINEGRIAFFDEEDDGEEEYDDFFGPIQRMSNRVFGNFGFDRTRHSRDPLRKMMNRMSRIEKNIFDGFEDRDFFSLGSGCGSSGCGSGCGK